MKWTAISVALLGLAGFATFGLMTGPATVTGMPTTGPIPTPDESDTDNANQTEDDTLAQATFGGGCFWCTEAVFQRLQGVEKVVSGYAGGSVPNPTYEQVCTGRTGHAECIQVTYDPEVVSYTELLEVFFKTHDPTTLNRQGADVGTQYRSVVFYHDAEQETIAREVKAELDKSGAFNDPIVTEITKLDTFYPAEDYHQNYFNNNPGQGYCQFVIVPKLEKFQKVFKEKLKQPR